MIINHTSLAMKSIDASAGFQRLVDHYAAQSRWPEVKRYAHEQLKIDPTEAVAHYYAGWAAVQMGEMAIAEQHAQSLSSKSPNTWPTHLLWSELYFRRGELNEALLATQRALRVAPEQPNIQHGLARVYLHLGQYPQAKQAIEAALQLEPDNALYRMFYAVVDRTLSGDKSPDSAAQHAITLIRILALEPHNAWVLGHTGHVFLTELFDYSQASSYFQQSLESDVCDGGVRKNLYRARLRQDVLFRVLIVPLDQFDSIGSHSSEWLSTIHEIVFGIGRLFNIFLLSLPAILYQHLVLSEICRVYATNRWIRALYRQLAIIPKWLRGGVWLLASVANVLLVALLIYLIAVDFSMELCVAIGISSCLNFAVSLRNYVSGRLAARKYGLV